MIVIVAVPFIAISVPCARDLKVIGLGTGAAIVRSAVKFVLFIWIMLFVQFASISYELVDITLN